MFINVLPKIYRGNIALHDARPHLSFWTISFVPVESNVVEVDWSHVLDRRLSQATCLAKGKETSFLDTQDSLFETQKKTSKSILSSRFLAELMHLQCNLFEMQN